MINKCKSDLSEQEKEKRYKEYKLKGLLDSRKLYQKENPKVKFEKTIKKTFIKQFDILEETYEKYVEKYSDIQSIKKKFTGKRKEGFESVVEFYNWYKERLEKQENRCYYCETSFKDLEILFKKGLIKSKKFTATPHIERLDSDKGYNPENMVFACALCNNAKSDMISEDDFREYFAKRMGDYLNEKIRK